MATLSSHPYVKEGEGALEKYLYDPNWYLREPWNPAAPPVSISHSVFEGALSPTYDDSVDTTVPAYPQPSVFPVSAPGVPPAPAYQQ
jgi:hypothetical protein